MHEHLYRPEIVIEPPLSEVDTSVVTEQLKDDSTRVNALIDLLSDPESARIALYLPDVWLPMSSQPAYLEQYRRTWWQLLSEIDYRADFVDGDIGELNHQALRPMVVKAAHLVPSLVKADILDAHDVNYLHNVAQGEIIEQSLADTLQVGTLAVVSLAEYTTAVAALERQVADPTITPARAKWLQESGSERIARDMARMVDLPLTEQLIIADKSLDLQIALRALARHGRHGADIVSLLPQVQALRTHDDRLVRRQAEASLRHLYHARKVPISAIDERGLPVLSGKLSENISFMQPEIVAAKRLVERLALDPNAVQTFYPIIVLGGSRLKGYGDDASDLDMAVLLRPNASISAGLLEDIFGSDTPKLLPVEKLDDGLRLDPDLSHLLYNALWIGDARETGSLRDELARAYNTAEDRRIALGRLEQDALRYRLMHKGYERHFPIEADDYALPSGGIDRNSTYWDPGYRRLATQIFAERVRLPRTK